MENDELIVGMTNDEFEDALKKAPTPEGSETKNKFISRCFRYMYHFGTKQRSKQQILAICYSKWRGGKKDDLEDIFKGAIFKEGDE